MGAKQEAVVHQFCQAWGDGKREHPDKEKILSLMADDAVWQLWVPRGEIMRGHAEIAAEIDRHIPMYSDLSCNILTIASTERVVFTEREDRYQVQGKPIAFRLIAVFELNANNRIEAWREYFDYAAILNDLGLGPQAVELV